MVIIVIPSSILRAEFDIRASQAAGVRHHLPGNGHHLLGRLPELVLHVDLAGGDEGVNPRAARVPDGFPRGVDVLPVAPREAADDGHVTVLPEGRVPDLDGDGAHGVEVVGGGGREAGLDDVDAEAGELAGHDELLGAGHGGAGGLLAVAERGVEDADVVGVVDAVGDVLGPPPRRRRLLLRRPDGAAGAGARSDGGGAGG